jgi:hypothetical protein
MLTFCDPPDAGTAIVSGDTTALHPETCVTVNVCPPAVIVPVREALEFGATVNATIPGPLPLAPAVMPIHGTFEVAVHVHACDVFTAKEPEPPAPGIVCPAAEIENAQPPLCVTVNV